MDSTKTEVKYYPIILSENEDLPRTSEIKTRTKTIKFAPFNVFNSIHISWIDYFISAGILKKINMIMETIYKKAFMNDINVFPLAEDSMSAFSVDRSNIKCVIVGQDPYPGWDPISKRPVANGKSFSTNSQKLPESLDVIRNSLVKVTGKKIVTKNEETPYDLQGWIDQGVLLLNRVNFFYHFLGDTKLLPIGIMDNPKIWIDITAKICEDLKNVSFILVGSEAHKLGSKVTKVKCVVHPSRRSEKTDEFDFRIFMDIPHIDWNYV